MGTGTQAIRTGHRRTAEGEHSSRYSATSSYIFGSAAEAAARFAGDSPGNIYSRFTNPTVECFEQRLAAMEGEEGVRGDRVGHVGYSRHLHPGCSRPGSYPLITQHLRQHHHTVQQVSVTL